MWTVPPRYKMQLQFRIFWLQYSNERICTDIGDIPSIECAVSCKLDAKYSVPPVCATWTVVPDIYSAFTAPHIRTSIFIWTYLRWYWWYTVNSMRLILQTLCQIPVYAIWTVVPDIYSVITVPHIEASIFNWTYLHRYWRHVSNSIRLILQTLCQIRRTSSWLRYLNCGPGHKRCNYSSTYSGFNIQLDVSALQLEICRECNVRYIANMVPNKAHILQITLCELWSRPYTV
jgi:hypothetical protein